MYEPFIYTCRNIMYLIYFTTHIKRTDKNDAMSAHVGKKYVYFGHTS